MRFTDTDTFQSSDANSKIPCESKDKKGFISIGSLGSRIEPSTIRSKLLPQTAEIRLMLTGSSKTGSISEGTNTFFWDAGAGVYTGEQIAALIAGDSWSTLVNCYVSDIPGELIISSKVSGAAGNYNIDFTTSGGTGLVATNRYNNYTSGHKLAGGIGDWLTPDLLSSFISKDKDAVKESLDIMDITRQSGDVAHFWDQLADYELANYPSDEKYIVVAGAGDSMGTDTGFMPYLIEDLVRKYGQGCVGTAGLVLSIGGGSYTTGNPTLSNAALTAGAFNYLPNGEFYTIQAGGSVTETPSGANINCGFRKIRFFYAIKPGNGTLTFSIAQTGATIANKVVNTSVGTDGTIGYVDFDSADGLLLNGRPITTVSSASQASHYLGCIMYLNSGVIPIRVGRGGSSSAQAMTGVAANIKTIVDAMDVRLVCFASKETDEDETLGDVEELLSRWRQQAPNCSYVLVGATPSPNAELDVDPAQNALLKQIANDFDWSFVDGQKLLRSTTHLGTIGNDTYGWNENGIGGPHLSDKAKRFIASWILNNILIGTRVAAGRFSPSSRMAANMDYSNKININFVTKTASAYNGSNFTQTQPDMGRFTMNFLASPAPVANSGLATQVGYPEIGGMHLNAILSYVINDGLLVDDVKIVLQCGGDTQTELTTGLTNNAAAGFRIIHGTEIISGNQIPYIQFAVKGSGTSETLSPRIYHTTTATTGIYAGGSWAPSGTNIYTVEYIGNISGTQKRFRAWHQSLGGPSNLTDNPQRRMIADWTGAITAGGSFANTIYVGLVTGPAPATPGSNRSIAFSTLQVRRPANLNLISFQDCNW